MYQSKTFCYKFRTEHWNKYAEDGLIETTLLVPMIDTFISSNSEEHNIFTKLSIQ